MSIPQTASSDTTAIAMSDLEGGKKGANITITSVETPQRPILGRRKTTGEDARSGEGTRPSYAGHEDSLTRVGNFLWKIHNESMIT